MSGAYLSLLHLDSTTAGGPMSAGSDEIFMSHPRSNLTDAELKEAAAFNPDAVQMESEANDAQLPRGSAPDWEERAEGPVLPHTRINPEPKPDAPLHPSALVLPIEYVPGDMLIIRTRSADTVLLAPVDYEAVVNAQRYGTPFTSLGLDGALVHMDGTDIASITWTTPTTRLNNARLTATWKRESESNRHIIYEDEVRLLAASQGISIDEFMERRFAAQQAAQNAGVPQAPATGPVIFPVR